MLADELIANDMLRTGLGSEHHQKLVTSLRIAQRFSLSREFADAATQISHTNMAAFKNAIQACRAPAPICWLEVPNQFRGDFLKDNNHDVVLAFDTERVGVLIEQLSSDGTRYQMTLGFKCGGQVCISGRSAVVDVSNNFSPRDVDNLSIDKLSQKFNGDDFHAALQLESRIHPIECKYATRMIDNVKRMCGDNRQRLKMFTDAEDLNWSGETLFWLSVLALINTRNVGSRVKKDLSKINKARAKSRKSPLLDYSICTIDAARFERGATRGYANRSSARAHFVRGHFKLRRTGVFWWRPSMRGNLGLGAVTKSYVVRHTPDEQRLAA